ncbi:hypothetical protein [Agrobacterium pusense]|uniref:hypothetical protein n=1 Tax=Agrobacterium pusense TaxID=648995 RepID=UPI0032DBC783
MLTAEKSITPNPARALYENFMTGEYGKKWDDLPAGVQKRWADALAAGVIAMTSVRIEPVEDFDTEALRAASLQPGTIAVLPEPTDIIFSDGEPYAAMTVDYLGCEYLSRDVENIEKIAAAGSKGPTEVVYLFRGTKSKNLPHKPLGYVTATRAKAMREGLAGSMTVYEEQNDYFSEPVYLCTPPSSSAMWLPISEADKSISHVHIVGDMRIGNSYPVWVRDADGRVYEALWSDNENKAYWWDIEGESPVDPVEFMPHPLARLTITSTGGEHHAD